MTHGKSTGQELFDIGFSHDRTTSICPFRYFPAEGYLKKLMDGKRALYGLLTPLPVEKEPMMKLKAPGGVEIEVYKPAFRIQPRHVSILDTILMLGYDKDDLAWQVAHPVCLEIAHRGVK